MRGVSSRRRTGRRGGPLVAPAPPLERAPDGVDGVGERLLAVGVLARRDVVLERLEDELGELRPREVDTHTGPGGRTPPLWGRARRVCVRRTVRGRHVLLEPIEA